MTYTPKPGDRIRQTRVYEGVVNPGGQTAVTDDGICFFADSDAYRSSTVTNELVEPHYPVGSLWMDADGVTWERGDDHARPWCHPIQKHRKLPEAIAERPLTRVYREGEQSGRAE